MKGGEDWDFWGKWERGEWEPETWGVLRKFLSPESTYIDVGAWIGPTVLWAAPLCRRVVALEPDPVAFCALTENTLALDNVDRMNVALVGHRQNVVTLHRYGEWGDSMSSLHHQGGDIVRVAAVTLSDVWDDETALVKVDIEGGESEVLPNIGPFLREHGCPLFLSVHEPFLSSDDLEVLQLELAEWESVERLADDHRGLYEVLCR